MYFGTSVDPNEWPESKFGAFDIQETEIAILTIIWPLVAFMALMFKPQLFSKQLIPEEPKWVKKL